MEDKELKRIYEEYRLKLGEEERPPQWEKLSESDRTYFGSKTMKEKMLWFIIGRPVGIH